VQPRSPLLRLLFLRGKNTRKSDDQLKAFLVVVRFYPRVCFVYELLLAKRRGKKTKEEKKRRRRRRDRRRGNKSRNARFSPSSFLSRILLSLSLSRGLLFPAEVVIYTRGQNKTKNNGIWVEKRSGFKSDRRNARVRSSSRTTFQSVVKRRKKNT